VSHSPIEELESHHHLEHAEHALHSGSPLIGRATLTIAVLAMIAAVVASLETTEGDKAIGLKNEAVLAQNRASDQWAFFQAKSLKKNLYQIAANAGGPHQAEYAAEAARYGSEEATIQGQAKTLEAARDKHLEEAEVHESLRARLTIAATLLHMSIAVATLSIILQRAWPWLAAMGLGAIGALLAVWAFLA
jgi:hypothetical protein